MVSLGKNATKLFMPNQGKTFSSYQVTIWPGFEIVLQENKELLTLVIDPIFKFINQMTILDKLKELNKVGTFDYAQLNNQVIMTTYNKRFYTIK